MKKFLSMTHAGTFSGRDAGQMVAPSEENLTIR
jgi:hypothetical protein